MQLKKLFKNLKNIIYSLRQTVEFKQNFAVHKADTHLNSIQLLLKKAKIFKFFKIQQNHKMKTLDNLFKILKAPFTAKKPLNNHKKVVDDTSTSTRSISDIEEKLKVISDIKKTVLVMKKIFNYHYAEITHYITILKNNELLAIFKEKTLYLEDNIKQVKQLLNLLETLNFRLTEKADMIKTFDLLKAIDNHNKQKLKILTEKIKTELYILSELYVEFSIPKAMEDWDHSQDLMKNEEKKIYKNNEIK